MLNNLLRTIIRTLWEWQCKRDLRAACVDIPSGTAQLEGLIDEEMRARYVELRRQSDEAAAEAQRLFDAEAARLGLRVEELPYLSNALSGWYAEQCGA